MLTEPKFRTIVKTESTNPIVRQLSVRRLATELHLKTDRVLQLLERDQIQIDQYNQVQISNTRGPKRYMTKTSYIKIELK